jgi:hypothetical protein
MYRGDGGLPEAASNEMRDAGTGLDKPILVSQLSLVFGGIDIATRQKKPGQFGSLLTFIM